MAMDMVSYGTQKGKNRSGAYLFLPDGDAHSLLTPDTRPHITVTTGPLVSLVWTHGPCMLLCNSPPP